jgi:hypothetical protein
MSPKMKNRLLSWITPGSVTTLLASMAFVTLWYANVNNVLAQSIRDAAETKQRTEELRKDITELQRFIDRQDEHNVWVKETLTRLLNDRDLGVP